MKAVNQTTVFSKLTPIQKTEIITPHEYGVKVIVDVVANHTDHPNVAARLKGRRYPGIPGNYGGFYQNIYEHLRLGKPLQTGAHDILNVIRVIEAAYRSQQERKIIELK